MDEIQRILIKSGKKDLAQLYFKKVASKNPIIIKASTIWKKLSKDVKKRLLYISLEFSSKDKKILDALMQNSLEDIYNAINNNEIEFEVLPGLKNLSLDAYTVEDFAKLLIKYDKKQFTSYPLKNKEDYIQTGIDPWGKLPKIPF